MTEQHPITPPPELVQQWQTKIEYCSKREDREAFVVKVFQLGADAELEACCKDILELIAGIYADTVIEDWQQFVELLRDGRRPSAATLALDAFDRLQSGEGTDEDWQLVRQQLEKGCGI